MDIITWLLAHIVDLFAIVGALYLAARLIVKLTPTPKDDEVVSKVGVFIQLLAKLFGLEFDPTPDD